MKKPGLLRSLLLSVAVVLFAVLPARAGSSTTAKDSCLDSYEADDTAAQAHELTGPEQHTFYKPFSKDDHDWVYFKVQAGWIYQIQARIGDFPTTPVLSLYDAKGILLARNDHYFGKDAEIWWWNNGPDQTLYLEATEARQLVGCDFYYTLDVIPWSPGTFQTSFGNQ